MKKLTTEAAEDLALKFRILAGLNQSEPINAKTILRKMNILALYRPLSSTSFGLSLKSPDGTSCFMLINSQTTRGRQHFTIAHEIYHLYYDENPKPHICSNLPDGNDMVEKNADAFASALLMPKEGIIDYIPNEEIIGRKISIATILKLEQLFSVSHSALLLRLKTLKFMTEAEINQHTQTGIKETARLYGYDTSLYETGNDNLVIGDFGTKARLLYEKGIISEGHYYELLNMITGGEN